MMYAIKNQFLRDSLLLIFLGSSLFFSVNVNANLYCKEHGRTYVLDESQVLHCPVCRELARRQGYAEEPMDTSEDDFEERFRRSVRRHPSANPRQQAGSNNYESVWQWLAEAAVKGELPLIRGKASHNFVLPKTFNLNTGVTGGAEYIEGSEQEEEGEFNQFSTELVGILQSVGFESGHGQPENALPCIYLDALNQLTQNQVPAFPSLNQAMQNAGVPESPEDVQLQTPFIFMQMVSSGGDTLWLAMHYIEGEVEVHISIGDSDYWEFIQMPLGTLNLFLQRIVGNIEVDSFSVVAKRNMFPDSF